jgi:hypothetical protein
MSDANRDAFEKALKQLAHSCWAHHSNYENAQSEVLRLYDAARQTPAPPLAAAPKDET